MAQADGLHHRRSIRLQGYDYSERGAYFVTLCTNNKESLFGNFVGANNNSPRLSHDSHGLVLNAAGLIVNQCWLQIPDHFPNVELDTFVVMPTHVHGIVVIAANDGSPWQAKRANDYSPLRGTSAKIDSPQRGTSLTIGSVVRGFKIGVTKWFRENCPDVPTVWQRNYYEHVIRNDEDLNEIRSYISTNPIRVMERNARRGE